MNKIEKMNSVWTCILVVPGLSISVNASTVVFNGCTNTSNNYFEFTSRGGANTV